MFLKRDRFCSLWDQFCRFAYLIKSGDHFCVGITFAAVHGQKLAIGLLPGYVNWRPAEVGIMKEVLKRDTLGAAFELLRTLIG